jgi:hypothetical protein
MFEPYSFRARRVIMLALHLAGYSGSDFIRTDHIILAMIYEDQDKLNEALEALSLDFSKPVGEFRGGQHFLLPKLPPSLLKTSRPS